MPGDDGGLGGSIDQLGNELDLGGLYTNPFGLGTVQTGLFPVRTGRRPLGSPSRSESVKRDQVAHELNMVGTSKKFIDPRSTTSSSGRSTPSTSARRGTSPRCRWNRAGTG